MKVWPILTVIVIAILCSVAMITIAEALSVAFPEDPTTRWLIMGIAYSTIISFAMYIGQKLLKT